MKKLIFLGLISIFIIAGCKLGGDKVKELTMEEANSFALEFINENLVQPGNEVTIKEVAEENDLYKVVVTMKNGQEIISYLTKDGKKFFPQVMDVDEITGSGNGDDQADSEPTTPPAAPTASTKTAKPEVELFVMSHCPFGTQIEKGILPVLDTLGDKIDFKLRFCDYVMHPAQGEVEEQLSQHCIQKNEPEKLKDYLYCFLEAGDSEDCLDKVGINQSKLSTCVAAVDAEFEVTKLLEDKSTWKSGQFPQFNVDRALAAKYSITGSPGLVVNGEKIQAYRDSASLLATICSGFEEEPEECSAQLSGASPSSGFGFGTSGTANDASCE